MADTKEEKCELTPENTQECENCGYTINAKDVFTRDNADYCAACYDEGFFVCRICGSSASTNDQCEADNHLMCRSCYEDNYTDCCDCGDTINIINGYTVGDDGTYCESCFYDQFFVCEVCDTTLPYAALATDGICRDCAEDAEDDGIHDYGYKPEPVFYRRKNDKTRLFFGVELETACEDSDKIPGAVKELMAFDSDRYYLKDDSSISPHGFELVTHPATLAYHLREMPWKKITTLLSARGFVSHNNKSCGLHVHASKDFFTQVDLIKLALFVHGNPGPLEKLARRNAAHYAAFADKIKLVKENAQDDADLARSACKCPSCSASHIPANVQKAKKFQILLNNPDRYEAINFLPEYTVEFRLFRGTLKTGTIYATLELVDAICQFVKVYNTRQVCSTDGWNYFLEFVGKAKYQHLPAYMVARGIKEVAQGETKKQTKGEKTHA